MFNSIGFFELLVVLSVGLIVLGPEKLPIVIKKISTLLFNIKKIAYHFTDNIEKEIQIEQLKKDLQQAQLQYKNEPSVELKEKIEALALVVQKPTNNKNEKQTS